MQPETSTTGAMSWAIRVAERVEGGPEDPAQESDGRAAVPGGRHIGVQRHRAHQRYTDLRGEPLTAARPEEGVGGAVVAGEMRTCSRSHRPRGDGPCVPCRPPVPPPSARRAGGVVTTSISVRGSMRARAHLDVTGSRRHVDEQVVEVSPATSSRKCWTARFRMRPRHMMARVLVGEEAHRDDLEKTGRRTGFSSGIIFLLAGLELAFHPEQAWDREAPDVGVEEPDHEPAPGESHGEVDRDRGLAHAALARHDGQHPGGGGDVGRRPGPAGPCVGPGAISGARSSAPISPITTSTAPTPGRLPTRRSTSERSWVRSGQPATVRATSTSTRPSGSTRDGPDHAEVDDVVAQLGVDHSRNMRRRTVVLGGRRAKMPGTSPILPVRPGSQRSDGHRSGATGPLGPGGLR